MPTWTKTGNIKGPKGDTGSTGPPGSTGSAATATAGTTTTEAPGTSASVVNAGTPSAAVFNFTIPRGDVGATGATGPASTVPGPPGSTGPAGSAATIAAGTTSTLAPGSSATVTNSGTSSAAVFDFGIPAGVKGDKGDTGAPGSGSIVAATTTADVTLPA